MLSTRPHVLAALQHGISRDDDLAARTALLKIDPVLRRAARTRLGSVMLDAELAATVAGLDRPPRAHIMRLAALAVAKKSAPPADDADAVTAAYAQLPPAKSRRAPFATLLVTAALLAGAGAIAFTILTHHAAPRTWVRPLSPPTAKAFDLGGVPLRDPAIDIALDKPLTELVVEAGRARDNGDTQFALTLAKLRATNLGARPKLVAAWQHALDAYATAVTTAQLDATDHDNDVLREAVKELTDQFAAVGLGYFLEGRFKNGYAYLQAYRVDEVVYVVTNGTPRRVLSLSRIDHLNTAYAVLGMQDENVGDPVLHMERIAEFVASTELPTLAPDAPYPIAEEAWLATTEGKTLAAAIGTQIRREYSAVLGEDATAGTQIAKLLVERAGIIAQWRDHLETRHVVFSATDDLFVPPDLLAALDGAVPHYQLERVEAIDGMLAELEAPRIHARVHDLVAATVRRHEAQHGFDYDRDAEARYPTALQAILGLPHDEDGNERAIVTSARHELSAYLSQVINDPATPHAALWHLAQQTFDRNRAGTGEFYAGVVVLEGLAKQLGLDVSGPTFHHGLDRERLGKLALAIANLPDAKLRDTASALWRDLYGEAATTIVDKQLVAAR
jgi:hypothetical protein